jgi:hypothetical protein
MEKKIQLFFFSKLFPCELFLFASKTLIFVVQTENSWALFFFALAPKLSQDLRSWSDTDLQTKKRERLS